MPPSDDDRYRDLLELIGQINRDLQARDEAADKDRDKMRQEIIKLRDDTARQALDYWKATCSAIRQLSDWFAETEDAAREERKAEREKRDQRDLLLIRLSTAAVAVVVLVLGLLLYVFR